MSWRYLGLILVLVLPFLWMMGKGFNHDPHAVPQVLIDHPAPDFKLSTLEGQSVQLSMLLGKPVVINFWATWCYPCQLEHDLLQRAAKDYANQCTFLGVVYQDTANDVQRYLSKHPSYYAQLLDINSQTAIDYGVAGVPETYIINAAGKIVFKHAGVMTADILHRVLDPLLRQP